MKGILIYSNSPSDAIRMTAWTNLVKMAVAAGKMEKGK